MSSSSSSKKNYDYDELCLAYYRAESAAKVIQEKYRKNRREMKEKTNKKTTKNSIVNENETCCSESDLSNIGDGNKGDHQEACIVKENDDDDNNNNNEGLYTAIFLACIALMTTVPTILSKIWTFLRRCLSDDKNNEVMPDTLLGQPPSGAP